MFNMNDYHAFESTKTENGGEMRFDIDKIAVAIVIAVVLMFFEKIIG